jgi:neurofibromin 1
MLQQSNCSAENAQLFVNCLEAMVETCLPVEDGEADLSQYPSMLSVSSNMNLSSSMSSLTLGSPTEKGEYMFMCIACNKDAKEQ